MKRICTLLLLLSIGSVKAQLLTWSPAFITESSTPIEITVDATKGNQGLKNYTPTTDVYVHIGAITTLSTGPSDWKYAKFTWGTTNAAAQCTYLGNNKWKYTITGGLRAYFGITNAAEKILKIAILFRNGAGTSVARNTDGSDMYVPVYDAGLYVRIDQPYREPKYNYPIETANRSIGDPLPITANSSQAATLKIFYNGTQVGASATGATTITRYPNINSYGDQEIVAEATNANVTKRDTVKFFVNAPINYAPLPAGVRDGINYEAGDTSVTLVLYAPYKTRVAVIGDFSNWQESAKYQMYKTPAPDTSRYWIRITGLTPGVEYGYQYLIDGTLRVADYYTEKVLDPYNDPYIPAANYPNLKPYPTGLTTGIVSVLQTAKPAYNWQVPNFVKPDKRNLIIYEMLVRDFVATQRWQTVKDSITYLKKLGINAIEVMPFNEFEGNNSWGYNPDFYLAPDKMYGTETMLRQFVDECHRQGIAVIMDIAMNHSCGLSPMVQMYWNSTLSQPAANNPWFNETAKHPFNVCYDFNHESLATKAFVDRVVEHWLTKYKIDGFRWDLSKGFTQTNSGNDVSAWGNYDASRIAIWKRIYDKMQSVAPKSYCILEHFAANNEETELANYGMLLWGNMNYNYTEASMGYVSTSNFSSGIYTNRGWTQPNLVTYMESHDEERMMYKNLHYGNSSGSYNVKDLNTALKRVEMTASFWALQPAPKMMWQFEELGYNSSINTCENGTINNNCRTSPKPIKWNYLTNANRKALHDVFAKLFWLRHVPNFLPTFVTNNINYNLGGALKWEQIISDSLKIMVYGNFDVVSTTGSITFPNSGTWYNYLNGGTKTATGAAETVSLAPGEYYVYVNRADAVAKVNALPLKLISFTAQRQPGAVSVVWNTENEVNVKQFIVERSVTGVEFSPIGTVEATNRQRASYSFADTDPTAVAGKEKFYYRLKMVDLDGKFSYSAIVAVNPVKSSNGISVYPNPVKNEQVYIRVEGGTQSIGVRLQDVSGRVYRSFIANVNSTGVIPVELSGLSNGVYIIKAETNKEAYTQQIVVQH